jgi:hypothetical protein
MGSAGERSRDPYGLDRAAQLTLTPDSTQEHPVTQNC